MVVGCGEHGKRVKEYEGEVELVDHAFVLLIRVARSMDRARC